MESIKAFKKELSNLFSVYSDARVGFERMVETLSRIKLPDELHGQNAAGEPNHLFTYSIGSEEEGNKKTFFSRTLPEAIEMNRPGSSNERKLGDMLLISLYALWEDRFRKEIGEELGETPLNIPIFGDIRLVRNCLVHYGGKWDSTLKRLEVLIITEKVVESEGGVLFFDKGRVLDVWWEVHKALDNLAGKK